MIPEFLSLSPEEKRRVQTRLCEFALKVWESWIDGMGEIEYFETVLGSRQRVDFRLPADAMEAVRQNRDATRVDERYREPIVALHDDDLEFPGNIEYAYYSIYNLFRKYVEGEDMDDWMIVNQALSAELREERWKPMLLEAIRNAT